MSTPRAIRGSVGCPARVPAGRGPRRRADTGRPTLPRNGPRRRPAARGRTTPTALADRRPVRAAPRAWRCADRAARARWRPPRTPHRTPPRAGAGSGSGHPRRPARTAGPRAGRADSAAGSWLHARPAVVRLRGVVTLPTPRLVPDRTSQEVTPVDDDEVYGLSWPGKRAAAREAARPATASLELDPEASVSPA